MDYETLYQQYLANEKTMKDLAAACMKLQKNIAKEMNAGSLKAAIVDLATLQDTSKRLEDTAQLVKEQLSAFPAQEYFAQGDYAEQMIAACKENNVDVIGEYPVYEMFPYKVRLDSDNQDVYLDKKKYSCVRPKAFIEMVKTNRDKLNSVNFKAQPFLNELADAYDMLILKNKMKQPDADLQLADIYKMMVPMARFRKEYDMQTYAFDLARLYAKQATTTSSGRSFAFGPDRDSKKKIRILDSNGTERYLTTISFSTKG